MTPLLVLPMLPLQICPIMFNACRLPLRCIVVQVKSWAHAVRFVALLLPTRSILTRALIDTDLLKACRDKMPWVALKHARLLQAFPTHPVAVEIPRLPAKCN